MNVLVFEKNKWETNRIDLSAVALLDYVILVDYNEFFYIKNRTAQITMNRYPIADLTQHLNAILRMTYHMKEHDVAKDEFETLLGEDDAQY